MSAANEFTARLADLLCREHAALAEFLVALSEFDARRVWLELGHPNLFSFLHRELRLSKGAAHYRKVAAELVLDANSGSASPSLSSQLHEGAAMDELRVAASRGGSSTVENLRVLCFVHNQYAARLAFGDRWMDRCSRVPAERGATTDPG